MICIKVQWGPGFAFEWNSIQQIWPPQLCLKIVHLYMVKKLCISSSAFSSSGVFYFTVIGSRFTLRFCSYRICLINRRYPWEDYKVNRHCVLLMDKHGEWDNLQYNIQTQTHMTKMLDDKKYHLHSALLKIIFHSFLIIVCPPWATESIQQNNSAHAGIGLYRSLLKYENYAVLEEVQEHCKDCSMLLSITEYLTRIIWLILPFLKTPW